MKRAQSLDIRIGKHMAIREQLMEIAQETERQISWHTRRIRELSKQHSISLNMTLPLEDK